MTRFAYAMTAGVLMLLSATQLRAQAADGPGCRGALMATLATGVPHVDMDRCAARLLPEIVASVERMHTRADTQTVRTLVSYAEGYRAPDVLHAALRVAADQAAPRSGRVGALMIAASQFRRGMYPKGNYVSTGQLLNGPVKLVCQWEASTAGYFYERPLPAGYLQEINETAQMIVQDSADDDVVRQFAGCLSTFITTVADPPRVLPSDIHVRYVCGLNFDVENSSSARARVRWEVGGSGSEMTVRPRTARTLYAFEKGTLRVYLGEALVGTVEITDVACPPGGGAPSR